MNSSAALASVVFGLASAVTWGAGDFSGGYGARRAPVIAVLLYSQIIGIVLLAALALLTHEALPAPVDLAYGAAAGIAGLFGLAALYRAMALGQMGVVAPVSGVIAAALPVIAGALTQGLPAPLTLLGFMLALAGVWFVSRTADHGESRSPRKVSIALAALSGLAFGAFLILIAQARHGSVFIPLVAARCASIAMVLAAAAFTRSIRRPPLHALPAIIMAGTMDACGNFFFVLASQAGRLDVAGVLSSLYPASTVVLALTLLRERLARGQALGIGLVLVAIPLISLP